MFPAIDDPPHRRVVLTQDGLIAGLEVYPSDMPVHTGTEGLAVVGAEADVHDGGAVLESPYQDPSSNLTVSLASSSLRVVQIHILVPRRGQKACRCVGREGERGYGIVWRLGELELRC